MSLPDNAKSRRKSISSDVIREMALRCLIALSILAIMALLGYFVNRDTSRVFRDSAMETSILVLTLLVIVATGIGVFLPMIRQVMSETDKLEAANAILDQRAAELAETLRELEIERDERRSRMQA